MTSIEVPYSIAAALPTLSVMDITNDVSQSVARSDRVDGIAYVHPLHALSIVRVQERDWFGAPNADEAHEWLRRCESMLEDFESKVFELHGGDEQAEVPATSTQLHALPGTGPAEVESA